MRPEISDSEARVFQRLHAYSGIAAVAATAVGGAVLFGWAFHIEILKSALPGQITMKPNTALAFIFSAFSLWLLRSQKSPAWGKIVGYFLAVLVILISAATLTEYFLSVDFRIDQFLFKELPGSLRTDVPGRMVPATAAAILAIGLALLSLNWKTERSQRPAQLLSLWSALIALTTISGYIYHASAGYGISPRPHVAVHTAVTLFLLSAAIFFARPDSGIARELTGLGSGSVMARRLLPAVFIVPYLLGWIRLQGQFAGLYGTELDLPLFATANVVVFSLLVWSNAHRMNVEFSLRGEAELEIRRLAATLETRVAERTETLMQQTLILSQQGALLEFAHDAVILNDFEGRILSWNRGAELMYGWPAPLAIGKIALDFLKTESATSAEEIQAQLLLHDYWEGEVTQYTREGLRLNVGTRWALQRGTDGAPMRVLTLNDDVTARKAAEKITEKLRQDQLRFKDEFLSHVSHELRSPLTAIKQFTTILLGGIAGDLNTEQREYQQIVLKNTSQLQSMIDDLLDVTRLETGKLSVDPERMSVLDAVTDAITTLQGSARAKGITLFSEVIPNLALAYADPQRVRQALIILIDNAIKFTPPGGTVVVQAGPHERDAKFVFFEISDTGRGIEPKNAERIFERLYQESEQGDRGRSGLGLGLFICKELVNRQGGLIWVKSEPGKGSVFSFTLPIFSLTSLMAPLRKGDDWPAKSMALVVAEMSAHDAAFASEGVERQWSREVRKLVQRCLLPNLDVLLPKMSSSADLHRFFVAAFADDKGASVLTSRIREQFERLPGVAGTGPKLNVSYTMLEPFPPDDWGSLENVVTGIATNLEQSVHPKLTREVASS